MDEFNPTMSGGEQADVDLHSGANTEAQGEGTGAEASGADGAGQQQRALNAAVAAARRRAEKDTEERMRRQTDEDIAAMRIPNPTKPGSYFTSKKDLEDYSGALHRADAERRAKAEGRSVESVLEDDEDKAFLRAQRTEAKKADEAREKKAERDRFIDRDLADFAARYPDVDIAALDTNPAFRKFVGSRYAKEPLADLYRDFLEVVGGAKAAQQSRESDRSARSTGYGSGGGSGAITAAQRAALREWNAEHPEMAMTEKEFLER